MSTLRVRTCLGEPVEGTLVLAMQERHKAELIKEETIRRMHKHSTGWELISD